MKRHNNYDDFNNNKALITKDGAFEVSSIFNSLSLHLIYRINEKTNLFDNNLNFCCLVISMK